MIHDYNDFVKPQNSSGAVQAHRLHKIILITSAKETAMPGFFKEVNIKSDMPTTDLAVRRVTYNLRNAKTLGTSAIKFIHGYGSSGTGGRIRVEIRRYLAEQKRRGLIRDYIPGEEFTIFSDATRRAFELCPELRRDTDLERHNNGVTIVLI
jgi:hypothetical protein